MDYNLDGPLWEPNDIHTYWRKIPEQKPSKNRKYENSKHNVHINNRHPDRPIKRIDDHDNLEITTKHVMTIEN